MKVLEGFDPFDIYEGPRHHERMAGLRATCPVAQLDSGLVVLSRDHDVKDALSNPTMSNTNSARAPGVDVRAWRQDVLLRIRCTVARRVTRGGGSIHSIGMGSHRTSRSDGATTRVWVPILSGALAPPCSTNYSMRSTP